MVRKHKTGRIRRYLIMLQMRRTFISDPRAYDFYANLLELERKRLDES